MYKLIEQTVTEARQSFTKTLRELAGDDEKETVVLVRKRGEPVAGIVSYRELARYAQWRVDQIRRHAGESGQLSPQFPLRLVRQPGYGEVLPALLP